MIKYTGIYTDKYELTMAQVYFMKGYERKGMAQFDYFFRKLPFGGGYAVFAGLETLLEALETLAFTKEDLDYLREQGFDQEFLDYLSHFQFKGTLYSVREGDLVFPVQPVLTVEGNIIEAQLVETLLLNILNYQTLIATKARRMRHAAGEKILIDFGLRRAPGPAGYYAARAAVIGGFNGTSNTMAGRDFDIPISGTMAHSFVESYDEELTAFREFAQGRPDDCVLLLDTYDTLQSGLPHAIMVAREMEKRGHRLIGVRLDSGDLAWLSMQTRRKLDEEGLGYVKIVASNKLDEHIISSLLGQKAPIDIFGVGTLLVTGAPDGAIDGVYKLAAAYDEPRIKLSETKEKITLPGLKQIYRILDEQGNFNGADVVALADEEEEAITRMHHPFEPMMPYSFGQAPKEPLLETVMHNGKRSIKKRSLKEIAAYSQQRFDRLPFEYKRFENPHGYKVGLSDELKSMRDEMIQSRALQLS